MKWKEFKETIEWLGVTDDVEIDYIDCGCVVSAVVWKAPNRIHIE